MLELGITLYFYVKEQSFSGELSSFPLLLSRFPKTSTSIKFRIFHGTPFGTPHMVETTNATPIWIAIDELLSGPFFPALTKVAFEVVASHGINEFDIMMTEYVESRMARCKGMGLLLCRTVGKNLQKFQ